MNQNLVEQIGQNLADECQNVLDRVPAERLKEYWQDSLDQGFDGYDEADKVVLIELLIDMAKYHDMVGD